MNGVSNRERLWALISLVAIAALVGVATHAFAPGGGPNPPREPLVVLLQMVFWLSIAADVVIVVELAHEILLRIKGERVGPPPRPRTHWAAQFLALVPLLGFLAAILFLRGTSAGRTLAQLPGRLASGAGLLPSSVHRGSAADDYLIWISLTISIAIVTVIGVWIWRLSRRPQPRPRARRAERDAVAEALEESIEALRADPDPRSAIIHAYVAMESRMNRVGLPRRRHEAPLEFMARILEVAKGAAADVRRLTQLFEVARFSRHEVDEAMRSSALLALSNIREEISLG